MSQLSLVDLAGSERSSRTGNIGDRLRETGRIFLLCIHTASVNVSQTTERENGQMNCFNTLWFTQD